MKGKLKDKKAIASILDPLKALSEVLGSNNDCVHVVYECNDNMVSIRATDSEKSNFAMYDLKADEVFDGYTQVSNEIGIWNVPEFINILNLYNDIDLDFTETDNQVNKFIINSEMTGKTEYYASHVNLISKGHKRLKTESMENPVSFTLKSDKLTQLKSAFGVFVDLDIVELSGTEGSNTIDVNIRKSDGGKKDNFTTKIHDIEVKKSFKINLPKTDLKSLLNCNNTFDVNIFILKDRGIAEFKYERDHYTMKFYIVPIKTN
jgi:hypothetical protein